MADGTEHLRQLRELEPLIPAGVTVRYPGPKGAIAVEAE